MAGKEAPDHPVTITTVDRVHSDAIVFRVGPTGRHKDNPAPPGSVRRNHP